MRQALVVCLLWAISAGVGGCTGGDPSNVRLASAGGFVTYKGGPLAGATVTYVPEKGPIAMGTTDLEGKFKLSTGAMSGAAVGSGSISISVHQAGGDSTAPDMSSAPQSAEEGAARMKQMMEMQRSHSEAPKDKTDDKSLIPAKYADAKTSGLTATVTGDASKNQFTFELKD